MKSMFDTKPSSINEHLNLSVPFLIVLMSLLVRFFCISSHNLVVEEAYYWNYAQHLDFSYLDHPPMVALLIKMSTTIFGINEFGTRITSLFCWLFSAYFSVQLTNLIRPGAGQYAIMLLAVLPFFFLQSLVITPDAPLILCWSADLYCLYRCLVLNESRYWYSAGIWLGLGLLSKYTIILLVPATFFYMSLVPSARFWFRRKEPYLSALIALFLFTPVIYWNAMHEWASFLFQGSRRINSKSYIHLHQFVGLLIFFIMPLGIVALWKLLKKNAQEIYTIDFNTQRFLQFFTYVPLSVFAVFSLNHNIKFNWIGPIILALIPWLAIICNYSKKIRLVWVISAVGFLVIYLALIITISFGTSEKLQQTFLRKFIAWGTLTQAFQTIARQVEIETKTTPIFVPLDKYPIGSELGFYQAKFLAQGQILKTYPIIGCHIFGGQSLMYRYWATQDNLLNKKLILISANPNSFENFAIKNAVKELSLLKKVQSYSQGQGLPLTNYYYKVVEMKGL